MKSIDNLTPPKSAREASDKNRYVRRMFNDISRHYDFLNHLLSAGVDRSWRRKAIKLSGLAEGNSFLDVACGTGDLSLEAAGKNPRRIVGIDFAENMLQGFSRKKGRLGLDGKVEVVQASAEELPFGDETFEVTAVAFGARNFGDLRMGLSEMYRVMKTGGRIVVLEFSKPERFPVKQLYFFYFKRILPVIGSMISGDHGAYEYLPNSVSAFPDGDGFMEVLREVRFRNIGARLLTFGIVTVYYGTK